MTKVRLQPRDHEPWRVLCLGAHGDDIEIGCGGTLLRWIHEYRQVEVRWVVFSADAAREREVHDSANVFLAGATSTVDVHGFRDGFFPFVGGKIKEAFENLKETVRPDIVFTHHRGDLHQDHQLISSLTWNTFRDHLILEYEIPKYDGDLGAPNLFVPLEERLCRLKVDHLLKTFLSQRHKHWFTSEVFLALARLRGVECQSPSGYAEAFYCRKLVL